MCSTFDFKIFNMFKINKTFKVAFLDNNFDLIRYKCDNLILIQTQLLKIFSEGQENPVYIIIIF